MSFISFGKKKDDPLQKPHFERRRRRYWPFVVLAVVLALVWFAPKIATHQSVLPWILAQVAPNMSDKVEFGSASAGWLSPIEIDRLMLHDLSGQPMLTVESVATSKRLVDFLFDRSDLGEISITRPIAQIRLEDDSSNLERWIEQCVPAEEDASSPSAPVGLELMVDSGKVTISESTTNREWLINDLMLSAKLSSEGTEISGVIFAQTSDGQESGKVTIDFGCERSSQFSLQQPGHGRANVNLERFPLSLVDLVIARLGVNISTAGYATTNLQCEWADSPEGPSAVAGGVIETIDLDLSLPDYLGPDHLEVGTLTTVLDAHVQRGRLEVRRFSTTSHLGSVMFKVNAPLSELSDPSFVSTLLSPATSHHYRLQGDLDLAKIVEMLPSTLALRDEVDITRGRFDFDVTSDVEENKRALRIWAKSDGLVATRAGKPIEWNRPIELTVNGTADESGVVVDRFVCQSAFLQAQGSGQLTQGDISIQADLNELATQLSQFFDLGTQSLAGNIQGSLNWNSPDQQNFGCQGNILVENLSVAAVNGNPWNEDKLTITTNATGIIKGRQLLSLQSATLNVNSSMDRLQVQLAAPLTDLNNASWPLMCHLEGNLRSWLARLQPWFTVSGWQIDGVAQADIRAHVSPQAAEVSEAKIVLRDLRAVSDGIQIQEPMTQVEGVANWQRDECRLLIPWLTVATTTVALRADQIACEFPENGQIVATGKSAFRGDVGRLYSWVAGPHPTTYLTGKFEGNGNLATNNGLISFDASTIVNEFRYQTTVTNRSSNSPTSPWKTEWQEAKVHLTAKGAYDPATDVAQFNELHATSETASLAAQGNLSALTAAPVVDLHGTIAYDLQSMTEKLRPRFGQNIQLAGRHSQPFLVKGPLMSSSAEVGTFVSTTEAAAGPPVSAIPRELRAQVRFGWENADVFGIPLSATQIDALLNDGVITTTPLDVQIHGGQVHLEPTVDLNQMQLVIAPGSVVQNLEITPEMCRSWMKYVTPLLADAANASGRFSVNLEDASVPLEKMTATQLAGQLSIHEAQIQPGPIAVRLVSLVDQISNVIGKKNAVAGLVGTDKKWFSISNQNVDFQMQEGRVFHRNLQIGLGDVQIRSEGWVGVDQSLSFVVAVPLLDKWIGNEPILAGLKGHEIKVPIQGTLSQPRIDNSAVSQLSNQLLGGSARQFLEGEVQKRLQKGLEKLLPGR